MGTVEYYHLAFTRDLLVDAPKIIMVAFNFGWDFEALNMNTLRIDAAENRADGAILPGGISCLQDDQDFVFMFREQDFLQFVQLLCQFGHFGKPGRFPIRDQAGIIWIVIFELNFFFSFDSILFHASSLNLNHHHPISGCALKAQ